MDTYVEDPNDLFPQVFSHLRAIQQDGSKPLDSDILKRLERNVDANTPQALLWQLLQNGETLLQTIQQDPCPLTRVLEKIVLLIPFEHLQTYISPEKLEEGLKSPSVPVQLLCLAYLAKASDKPSGAAFVAASSSLCQLLITTWFSVTSTEVSERALECIISLLAVDSPENSTLVIAEERMGEAQGQGLLWRRLFHDPNVYALMFLWTSLRKSNWDLNTKKGKQNVTISQARLFDFLVRTSQMDWAAISSSTLSDVEKPFLSNDSAQQPYGGLLRYAASQMIDPDDYLMEVLRHDFFTKLVKVLEEGGNRNASPRLIEAIQREASANDEAETAAASNGMHL
jgi:hypothetical protein